MPKKTADARNKPFFMDRLSFFPGKVSKRPPIVLEDLLPRNAPLSPEMRYNENPLERKSMPRAKEVSRCPWVDTKKPDYVAYHDEEWGVPVHDDRLLFEFLTLEAAQAGLSWYTVLRKRENYRTAFAGFDPGKVARFTGRTIGRLLENPGIIRNRAKIEAAVNNARRFLEVREAFGTFDAYLWQFVDGRPIVNELRSLSDYPATSPESDRMSRDLRQRGFRFVGSTICYAHMQATGMVNDHVVDCFRRRPIIRGYPHRRRG
jgi:DNA-3-methyladenine glycosylase I